MDLTFTRMLSCRLPTNVREPLISGQTATVARIWGNIVSVPLMTKSVAQGDVAGGLHTYGLRGSGSHMHVVSPVTFAADCSQYGHVTTGEVVVHVTSLLTSVINRATRVICEITDESTLTPRDDVMRTMGR